MIKALCWEDKKDKALPIINNLLAPEGVSLNDRVFLRDYFKLNYLKADEL